MELISLKFLMFWFVTSILYYLIPKLQWQILLIASLCFYIFNARIFPGIIVTFALLMWIISEFKNEKRRRVLLIFVILCQVILLIFYRFYSGQTLSILQSHIPVGMSFFTLTAMGYCLDVHWKRIKPERNLFKLILFLVFFPALLQGPINRYGKFQNELFIMHKFSWKKICRGLQRFLWGLFKKLIIVERMNNITSAIFSKIDTYSLSIFFFGVFCFAIELYADFSGYMDMVIGIGETFGIKLPENFKRPYFSTSVTEFWRRWHITLGTWFKDYVMYAFIMYPPVKKVCKKLKKKNKSLGRLLPTILGTMLVWFLTGLWHGGSFGYILWGIFYGIVICSHLCLENFHKNLRYRPKMKNNKWYQLVCIVRTWCVVFMADILICADTWSGIKIFTKKLLCGNFWDSFVINQMKVLLNSYKNVVWLVIGCSMLLIASLLEERYGDIFKLIERQNIVIRWIIWHVLIFVVFLFGTYGSGYDVSTFLYQIY